MYPVQRSSQRLSLRELTIDDVDAVLTIYGDQEATEHLSFEPRTRDQVSQIVARSIASATAEPRSEYALAVIERDTNTLIGYGRLAMDPHQQRAATFASRCARRPGVSATAWRPSAYSWASGSKTSACIASGAHAPRSTKRRRRP